MNVFIENYLVISILFISVILSILLFFINFFLVVKTYDVAKVTIYECGFDPMEDSRERFDVIFYMIAILFIIFDIEIMFLFPWAISLTGVGFFGYILMIFFLLFITLGFFYEWFRGALEW